MAPSTHAAQLMELLEGEGMAKMRQTLQASSAKLLDKAYGCFFLHTFLAACGVCQGEEPARVPHLEGAEPQAFCLARLGVSCIPPSSPHFSEGLAFCVYYLTVTPAGKGPSFRQGRCIVSVN